MSGPHPGIRRAPARTLRPPARAASRNEPKDCTTLRSDTHELRRPRVLDCVLDAGSWTSSSRPRRDIARTADRGARWRDRQLARVIKGKKGEARRSGNHLHGRGREGGILHSRRRPERIPSSLCRSVGVHGRHEAEHSGIFGGASFVEAMQRQRCQIVLTVNHARERATMHGGAGVRSRLIVSWRPEGWE